MPLERIGRGEAVNPSENLSAAYQQFVVRKVCTGRRHQTAATIPKTISAKRRFWLAGREPIPHCNTVPCTGPAARRPGRSFAKLSL